MATSQIPAGFKLVPDDNQAPEARGKAAALSAYLARKGSPKAGKRLDRAVAKFETMWSQAPDALKEKYAGRSQKTDLAPSERSAPIPRPTNASLNATRPGETNAQAQVRFRENRTGKAAAPVGQPGTSNAGPVRPKGQEDLKVAGTPITEPGNSFADLTKQPEIPAGGVNSVGDGVFAGGSVVASLAGKSPADQRAILTEDATKNPPEKPTLAGLTGEQIVAPSVLNGDYLPKPVSGPAPAVTPTIAPARPPTAAEGNNSPEFLKSNAEYGKIADQRMAPGGPAAPAARPTMDGNQPTGAPVMATPMSKGGQPMDPAIKSDNGAGLTRVNRLTGLPFGFRPGDALPKSADGAMQQRSTDSGVRQVQAQAQAGIPAARPAAPVAGPRPMPRGPASQPERTGSAMPPVASPRQVADDPDILRKGAEARANYQANFGNNSSDKDFDTSKNAPQKLYEGASEMDKIRLGRQTLEDAARQTNELNNSVANAPRASNPANTRVIARRPATPEESRTGKVVAPARRPVMLAR